MQKKPAFLLLLVGLTWASAQSQEEVPIVDGSYFDSDDRPAAKFFSQFESPRSDRKGLALFDGLDENGRNPFTSFRIQNRPQLRSLDGADGFDGIDAQNGFQEASKVRKTFSRRRSSKSVRVKSGETSSINPVTVGSTLPRFSEEVVYRRSNNARERQTNQNQVRSLRASAAGLDRGRSPTSTSCTRCSQMYATNDYDTSGGGSQTQLRSLGSTASATTKRETEGLRLYNKLIDEGRTARSRSYSHNQNHLRSLDNSNDWAQPQPVYQIPPYTHQRRQESSHDNSHSSSSTYSQSSGSSQLLSEATTPRTNVHYHVSTGAGSEGRRSSTSPNRLRSLSSSITGSYNNNGGLGGCTSYACRMRSQSTSTLVGPDDNLGISYPAPSAPVAATSRWAEKEERSHSARRTISHTVNGVETNGLGVPYTSEEEANYRREEASSGGVGAGEDKGNGQATRTASSNNLRSLQTSSMYINRGSDSAGAVGQTQTHSRTPITPAPTLSVGNGQRRRRTNCTQIISATSLSDGAESVTDIVGPPPCIQHTDTTRSGFSSSSTHSRSRQLQGGSSDMDDMPYPPVQTLGQRGGEVEARVLQTDNEDEEYDDGANRREQTGYGYTSGGRHKKAYFRRTTFKNYTTSEFPPSFSTFSLNN